MLFRSDMDGKEVISKLRTWSDTPVIVLSARNIESEKIAALDIGADDFVNKPFDVGELMARLRVALRGRERRFAARDQFSAGGLEVNFADRRVFVDRAEVRLTPREFELLQILARHAGRPVTHTQINAAVRGPGASADPQFVRVLVGQLRQKLETDPSSPRFVLTEPGFGYRLIAED